VRQRILETAPELLAGFMAAGEAHMVTVLDRYLDTDAVDGRLAIAGMRARLRTVESTVTLTVKRSGALDRGVTTRVELEGPASSTIDPEQWPASEARAALLEVIGDARLSEIARLRQSRLTRLVARGSTIVELSLDELEALDGEHVAGRRFELEAELVEGEPDDLIDLGDALRGIVGVGEPLGSKLRFALDAVLVR
jgi:inorganic triphosphatase YgiF